MLAILNTDQQEVITQRYLPATNALTAGAAYAALAHERTRVDGDVVEATCAAQLQNKPCYA
eukprot:2440690-Lingulodinium_polyedra.AAC.1